MMPTDNAVPSNVITSSTAGPARLVVLVSGTGSNLLALLRACQDPAYGAAVVGVVADKECAGLGHAHAAAAPTLPACRP